MRYQPLWINGKQIDGEYQRECAERYEPIREFLTQFRRPFSVFDLGANMGYFTFRIAQDFPHATVIAVDHRSELVHLAKANNAENVIVIPRRMTGDQLFKLAECEEFDVVLALNVLHHIKDWHRGLVGAINLGWHLIAETPGPDDKNALNPGAHRGIYDTLRIEPSKTLLTTKSHVTAGASREMIHIESSGYKTLAAQTLDSRERRAPWITPNTIVRDFGKSEISFADRERRWFVPGMNLWNWALLGGCWPNDIAAKIDRGMSEFDYDGRWMDDFRPWNFILTGRECVPIDIGNKKRKEPESNGRALCLEFMQSPDKCREILDRVQNGG
jgi:trans-aconitate methyltransferase